MTDIEQWLRAHFSEMESSLAELVGLNSFTTNIEGGQRVANRLVQLFTMDGLECERVGGRHCADHLVFRSIGRSSASPVALIGHLDTVFPPGTFEGYTTEGSFRRGAGVLDMKGGLVVMAYALKALAVTVGLDAVPPVRVIVVADEEVGSPHGAEIVRREVAGCGAALVFESGRALDAIVTRRKGTGNAVARATGRAAHAGNSYWEGANAIWALAKFVDKAQGLSSRTSGVTVNVGVISGGTSKNTVPAEAEAELDLRFHTAADAADLWSSLDAIAAECGTEGCRVWVDRKPGRQPMETTDATRRLLEAYAACARSVGLGSREAELQGGGSDGNTAADMGIPTLDGLGPRGRNFHTPDELIEVETLVPKAAAAALYLRGA
jgi:glutamate carboxypeptidase